VRPAAGATGTVSAAVAPWTVCGASASRTTWTHAIVEAPGCTRANALLVVSVPGRPDQVVAPATQAPVEDTDPRRTDSSPGKAAFEEVPRTEMATSKATVPVFFAANVPRTPWPGRRAETSSAGCCVMRRPLDPLVTGAALVLAVPFQRA
jgi:hypothetical protein